MSQRLICTDIAIRISRENAVARGHNRSHRADVLLSIISDRDYFSVIMDCVFCIVSDIDFIYFVFFRNYVYATKSCRHVFPVDAKYFIDRAGADWLDSKAQQSTRRLNCCDCVRAHAIRECTSGRILAVWRVSGWLGRAHQIDRRQGKRSTGQQWIEAHW